MCFFQKIVMDERPETNQNIRNKYSPSTVLTLTDMTEHLSMSTICLRVGAFALVVIAVPLSHASTVWTGPEIKFTQSANSRSDTILAGKVVLTRGISDVLYNTAARESSARASSPADTEWAFGALSDFATLSYQSLESMRNGNLAGLILNIPMVMHLINEDIYLSVKFTAWGQHSRGGFAYTRSTPAVAVAPSVSITSPPDGAVFAAPASLDLTATASVGGGTVTNVEYFAGTNSLGLATVSPFKVTGSISIPGSYALAAVATAAGVSATSAVVNITIISPVPVSLTAAGIANGLFSFSYSANPGLSYIIQASSNLFDWAPVGTNVALSNPVLFSDTFTTNNSRYYRVGRLPNP
jgi:hypothetical protein